jgi:hypothetical protein
LQALETVEEFLYDTSINKVSIRVS